MWFKAYNNHKATAGLGQAIIVKKWMFWSCYHTILVLQCDVDCGCTVWEDEGACSKSCGGGLQKQTRICGIPAQSGKGKTCPGDLERYEACNTQQVCKVFP